MGDECHNRNVAATSLLTRAIAPALTRTADGRHGRERPRLPARQRSLLPEPVDGRLQGRARRRPRRARVHRGDGHGAQRCRVRHSGQRNGRPVVHGSGPGGRRPLLPGLRPGRRQSRPRRQRHHRDAPASEASRWPAHRRSCGSSAARRRTPSATRARCTASRLTRNPEYTLPALGFAGTPTGIDLRRVVESGVAPVINTGIAHREPGIGQIGAGIARAPLGCFAAALRAMAMSSASPPHLHDHRQDPSLKSTEHQPMRRSMASVKAEPYEFEFDPRTTALVMIDFQRDFVDPGGFGEALGNDVSLLRRAVPAGRAGPERRARGRAVHRPHAGGPPFRPRRLPTREESARPAQDRDRRSGSDGPDPGARRVRTRHRQGAHAGGRRAGGGQAGQGRLLRDGPARDSSRTATSRGSSCAASRPRSASTPPCARRTIGATTASSSRTAWPPTSPSSTRPRSRWSRPRAGSSAGSPTHAASSRRWPRMSR